MPTITIDPVNRIEGHLKATVEVDGSGNVQDAKLTGNLFRGLELILNRRDPRDAPVITQRICGVCPTSHQISSVMCLDSAFGITGDPGTHTPNGDVSFTAYSMPDNGRIIRNIIHGCDMVMSHITHLYHLSALDFINTTSFPGMAPWYPSYTASDMLVSTGGLGNTDSTSNLLVQHYVEALAIRRKCHTAGALLNGRQPIGNAMVPGGVTTLFSSTYPLSVSSTTGNDTAGPFNATETKSKFKDLMNQVRAFINTKYIPDVLTVAGAFSDYWNVGAGCQRLLSYGGYPTNNSGTMLLKRGLVNVLTPGSFDQENIVEYVDSSYYGYGLGETGLHPFAGRTNPNMTGSDKYSWIKAPRLMNTSTSQPEVCEVGPLARMVNTYVSNTQVAATETDMASADRLATVVSTAYTYVGATPTSLAAYNAKTLVDVALSIVAGHALATATTSELALLYSPLGRHAARALEAKYVADAMAGSSTSGITSWVDQLVANQPCYTYTKIPKQIVAGYGLIEVPRGSLGHWIKVEGRKIAKYQCVVPTTWNASPAVGTVIDGDKANRGPAEQSLMDTNIGTTTTEHVINILRVLHPFDFCIACAVHVVTPEGKEKLKFAIGADGRPMNIEVKE
jgi:hydrogenase large subunit